MVDPKDPLSRGLKNFLTFSRSKFFKLQNETWNIIRLYVCHFYWWCGMSDENIQTGQVISRIAPALTFYTSRLRFKLGQHYCSIYVPSFLTTLYAQIHYNCQIFIRSKKNLQPGTNMADTCVDGSHWLWLEKCSLHYFTTDGSIRTYRERRESAILSYCKFLKS